VTARWRAVRGRVEFEIITGYATELSMRIKEVPKEGGGGKAMVTTEKGRPSIVRRSGDLLAPLPLHMAEDRDEY